jgi:hypothetical protein
MARNEKQKKNSIDQTKWNLNRNGMLPSLFDGFHNDSLMSDVILFKTFM